MTTLKIYFFRDTTIKQLSVKLEQKWTVSATPDAKHGKVRYFSGFQGRKNLRFVF